DQQLAAVRAGAGVSVDLHPVSSLIWVARTPSLQGGPDEQRCEELQLADSTRIEQFMRELGRSVRVDGRVYLTGGATAVLYGWRQTTIDVDIKLIPDRDEILREIPRLKEALNLNVELAAPSDFIPIPKGWEERSPLIRKEGRLSFHHFDPVAQALSKAERGHDQDT
ncbi:MAG TPA: hypothetical protein VGC63_02900, partial [Solirubrobacterales bacterium]